MGQRVRNDSYAAVAIGDSIVMRWPDAMLQQAIGMKTLNAGIGGDTAPAVLWRLQNGEWPKDVRYVFVLVGTNDIWALSHPPCDVYSGIRAVVDEAHRIFPQARILVSSILPRGMHMSERDEEIRMTNAALSEGTGTGDYTFVDAHDAFLCDRKNECDLVIGHNNLHPSVKGYRVLGDILHHAIETAK
jgi:lysophospholipase L1-like esterase